MKIDASTNLLSGKDVVQMKSPNTKGEDISAKLDTVIIHYTAGTSAKGSAAWLCNPQAGASAHLVIGREGEIYQLIPFTTKAWHAGVSQYQGRKGFNNYSIGIELDNAGPLKKVGSQYQHKFGRKFSEDDVMYATHPYGKPTAYWHTYTEKQLEATEAVCRLLIETYNIKMILGHEEVSPGRKSDPGPAFPLDDFKKLLTGTGRDKDDGDLPSTGSVSASKLNIREGAGGNFKKVAKALPKGTKVNILEENGDWYKVNVQIEGWVSKKHIDET